MSVNDMAEFNSSTHFLARDGASEELRQNGSIGFHAETQAESLSPLQLIQLFRHRGWRGASN